MKAWLRRRSGGGDGSGGGAGVVGVLGLKKSIGYFWVYGIGDMKF